MILSTGFTQGYQKADAYLESIKRHCNVATIPFSVGHERAGCVPVPEPAFPKAMLQMGAFTEYLPGGDEFNPVILFTDSDIIMQRGFAMHERAMLDSLIPGEVAIGINQFRGATLADERPALAPLCGEDELSRLFPGWRDFRIWNTGAVAARLSTWRELYAAYIERHEAIEACFANAARVQWLICYIVGRYMTHVELPQTIHSHGHCGIPEGVEIADGVAKYKNTTVVLRHMLL